MPTGDTLIRLRALAEVWRHEHWLETGHSVWVHCRKFDFAVSCLECARRESERVCDTSRSAPDPAPRLESGT